MYPRGSLLDCNVMEHLNWQLRFSTHRERLSYAFGYSLFSDVEFSVVDCNGNNATLAANKFLLAVCSPIFEAMFYGNLAETKFPIHVTDCTEEGLKEVIRYAYYEEAKLTRSNVMEVFYIAKKYMIPTLEAQCNEYIKENVTKENAMNMLSQVLTVGDTNLENHLWKFVDKNIKEIVLSNSFLYISRDLLCKILMRDTLEVSELHLFKALDKWVTKRIEEDEELVCNGETKRTILGDHIVRLIRFPLMTEKDFAEVVLPCKILTVMEMSELISIYNCIEPSTKVFCQNKRSPGELLISEIRFHGLMKPDTKHWNYVGNPDSLDFSVDKPVNLVGVRIFGEKNSTYNVTLNINKNDPYECILMKESSSATEEQMIDDRYYGFTVNLGKPVRLDPGVEYNIQAQISGPPSWYGIIGKGVVSAGEDIQITFKGGASRLTNFTSVNVGQFPSLVLETV